MMTTYKLFSTVRKLTCLSVDFPLELRLNGPCAVIISGRLLSTYIVNHHLFCYSMKDPVVLVTMVQNNKSFYWNVHTTKQESLSSRRPTGRLSMGRRGSPSLKRSCEVPNVRVLQDGGGCYLPHEYPCEETYWLITLPSRKHHTRAVTNRALQPAF